MPGWKRAQSHDNHEGQQPGRVMFVPVFLRRRVTESADAELAGWNRRLWVVAAGVRDGAWSGCQVTGWPDNTSADRLVAWGWSREDVGGEVAGIQHPPQRSRRCYG